MSVFRLLWIEFVERTLKSKRIFFLVYVTLLQCMLINMGLKQIVSTSHDMEYSFCEVFLSFYSGNEPFLKLKAGQFPYGWFVQFICPLIMSFDHIYHDLSRTGVQILPRVKKRCSWWYMNCMWVFLTILLSYVITLGVIMFFCFFTGIPISLKGNLTMLHVLSPQYEIYEPNRIEALSPSQLTVLLLSPFIAVLTLSFLQMFLSLFLKPLYSFVLAIGLVVLSLAEDWFFLFPRLGMVMQNNIFLENGYEINIGISVCFLIVLFSIFMGSFRFKHYDVILSKEESR